MNCIIGIIDLWVLIYCILIAIHCLGSSCSKKHLPPLKEWLTLGSSYIISKDITEKHSLEPDVLVWDNPKTIEFALELKGFWRGSGSIPSFYKWKSWSPVRLKDTPEITQLTYSRAWRRSYVSKFYSIPLSGVRWSWVELETTVGNFYF